MSISIFATFASDQFYQSTKVEIIWCKRMFFNEIKKHSPKTLIANLQSAKQDIILPTADIRYSLQSNQLTANNIIQSKLCLQGFGGCMVAK